MENEGNEFEVLLWVNKGKVKYRSLKFEKKHFEKMFEKSSIGVAGRLSQLSV